MLVLVLTVLMDLMKDWIFVVVKILMVVIIVTYVLVIHPEKVLLKVMDSHVLMMAYPIGVERVKSATEKIISLKIV